MLYVICDLDQWHNQNFFKGGVHNLNIDNSTIEKNLVHTYYKLFYTIVYIYRPNGMVRTDDRPRLRHWSWLYIIMISISVILSRRV